MPLRAVNIRLVGGMRWTSLVFGMSISLVLMVVPLASDSLVRRQARLEVHAYVQQTSSQLARRYEQGGLPALQAEMAFLRSENDHLRFGLRSADEEILADESLHSPKRAGWIEYSQDGRTRLALIRVLPDGTSFSVSEQLSAKNTWGAWLARAIAGLGVIGAAGAIFFAVHAMRAASRFMDRISASLAKVAAGDLSARLEAGSPWAEFAAVCQRVNETLAELQHRDAEMKTALRSIAHEMRTPLSHVLQHMAVLADPDTSEGERAHALDRIDERLRFVLRGYDAILRLAHLETGARPPPPALDLGPHAANVAAAFDAAFADSGCELAIECASTSTPVDPDLIAIAVSTLLENVLAHTPPGTRAEVATWSTPEATFLRVIDNGPGIGAEDRAHALERFHRGANSKGLGLGLTIVAAIASRAGGTLTLSDARPGLCVTLRFKPAAMRPHPKTASAAVDALTPKCAIFAN